jgi:hypothetical protein
MKKQLPQTPGHASLQKVLLWKNLLGSSFEPLSAWVFFLCRRKNTKVKWRAADLAERPFFVTRRKLSAF